MSDVAKLAGVGTMTVSRVLNGNVHVSKDTRARVLEAIAKLNYVPN
jgi:LacI family transcriptional regulator